MITKDNLLWDKDEYEAGVNYKGNGFSSINVLLSDNITIREIQLSGKSRNMPKTKEEFKETLENAILLYSAIKKNHNINGSNKYSKILFRGTREGKEEKSFLSTSDSARTAFDFARAFKTEKGVLLALEPNNVPWIDINKVLPNGDSIEEEREILFLPSEVEEMQEISLEECFSIAKNQGEQITSEKVILKKFGSLRCGKVKLREMDYAGEKTELTKEDLCDMYNQYKENLNTIRNSDKKSEEYNQAHEQVLQFKKNCCTWIHQKFNQINKNIENEQNKENEEIQIPQDYNIEEVHIGNTGKMYQIQDKENEKEYYFKPGISKSGEEQSYRAYIQEAAYDVQKIINPGNAVRCNTIEIDGMFGAIQDKIEIDDDATYYFKSYFNRGRGQLSPEIIKQIMDEYLVDFCLCNYDSHSRNFIIDTNGRLRGIDKEQSFRYIKEDKDDDMMFSVNYNQGYGENPSIYSILFDKIKQGEISYEYIDELKYRASRISQYPDDEYKHIFENYAYGKAKTSEEAEVLLNRIVNRKNNILEKVEELYNQVYNEWYKNNNTQKSEKQLKENRENTDNKQETISMKSLVTNAITQGIAREDVEKSDKEEYMMTIAQEKEGVTKDD